MRRYNEYEINILKQNKNVHLIREDRLELTLEFRRKMYNVWKIHKNIECLRELLEENGLSSKIIKRDYLRDRQRDFKRNGEPSFAYGTKRKFENEIKKKYKQHPYIKFSKNNEIIIRKTFYNETYILYDYFSFKEILITFEIDPRDFCDHTIQLFESHYTTNRGLKNDVAILTSEQLIRIQKNKQIKLEEVININLNIMRIIKNKINKFDKKTFYKLIKSIPIDLEKKYTLKYFLSKIQISKSSFYDVLNNKNYLEYIKNKKEQDERDIKQIRKILNTHNRPIGTRMMYMYLKNSNHKFARSKIQRLYKKYNINCNIRMTNKKKTQSKAFMKRAVKDNILSRKFKMAKPYTNLLTDVSYLKYNSKVCYLSTIKDAVTGKILAYEVGKNNGVKLAVNTFKQIDKTKLNEESFLHSDQGNVYLNQTYQIELESFGLKHSMSRRGNCWDNASMETFFGHLKDECDYSNCKTIYEVKTIIDCYINYYNNERPQWNRNKMTPVQYEFYMNNLTEDEFNKYLINEKKKYDIMKSKSKEKLFQYLKKSEGII